MESKSSTHLSLYGRAALTYATQFGMAVFPCIPREKRPLTLHGCKDASNNPETISAWWDKNPHANIGIACGIGSAGGLCVLDIDGDVGQESLRALEREYGDLPRTPEVITGKGLQFYFHHPSALKNRVGVRPGIDIRSEGGYVIAPPSIHPTGRSYTWEVEAHIHETTIAPLPDWLAEQILGDDHPNLPSNQLLKVINSDEVIKGERNQTLASVTGHLLRRYVEPKLALRLLRAFNAQCFRPPLSETELSSTVNSIATLELKRRKNQDRTRNE